MSLNLTLFESNPNNNCELSRRERRRRREMRMKHTKTIIREKKRGRGTLNKRDQEQILIYKKKLKRKESRYINLKTSALFFFFWFLNNLPTTTQISSKILGVTSLSGVHYHGDPNFPLCLFLLPLLVFIFLRKSTSHSSPFSANHVSPHHHPSP